MILGTSVLELSSDNHLVDGQTDRQTDRPTDMSKAIYPLFFEGGGGGIISTAFVPITLTSTFIANNVKLIL